MNLNSMHLIILNYFINAAPMRQLVKAFAPEDRVYESRQLWPMSLKQVVTIPMAKALQMMWMSRVTADEALHAKELLLRIGHDHRV